MKADRINMMDYKIQFLKGMYYFYKEETEKSLLQFESGEKISQDKQLYYIGKAIVEFSNKNYKLSVGHL